MIEQLTWIFGDDSPLASLIWTIIVFVSVFIVHFLVFFLVKRLAKSWERVPYDFIRKRLRKPTLALLLIFALNIVSPMFEIETGVLQVWNHIVSILMIISIAWLLIGLVEVIREFALSQYDISSKNNLAARKAYTQFKVLERILDFLIIVLAIGVILMTFEKIRQVGVSLLASAGIAGIILGFAAQRIIAAVLAGFQIAITQPIRIDDVVIVENEWGWIEEITLTYVVIKIWDRRRLVVPTTYFIEKPFQNWTRVSSDIMGTVFIHTDYDVSFDELRKELTRVLESSPHWDGDVNVLQVTDAKSDSVEIRALMSAADSPTAWDLRVEVREKLIEFIQRNYPNSLPRTRVEVPKPIPASQQDRGTNGKSVS